MGHRESEFQRVGVGASHCGFDSKTFDVKGLRNGRVKGKLGTLSPVTVL